LAPSITPPRRPRVVWTEDEWAALVGDAHKGEQGTTSSFVRHHRRDGTVRYFRVCTGPTWRDCAAPEIDHIFRCQHFVEHDCFFIYALLGRLMFEVGERDGFEMTLFFEGIGGCGKSTIIKAVSPLWPDHLRAVLSSNCQVQFGMSDLANGLVCICSEVSTELNLPQEEWQDATGGATLTLAVKHKPSMVVKWKSQFLWAGNAFPTKYKNEQGQVSRRLAGVLMKHPVRPRSDNILKEVSAKIGSLQRKMILAYEEFLALHRGTDPMSVPERLPPAFASYYRTGRRRTDAFEAFLSDPAYVVVGVGRSVQLKKLKERFDDYRVDMDLGKSVRWSYEMYRTPFSERSIFVERDAASNVDVAKGVDVAMPGT